MQYKKKMNFIKIIMSFAMILMFMGGLPLSGSAHSVFIQSSRYFVNKGKASPLFFCFGHHIPVDDGVRASKLKYIKIIDPEKNVSQVQMRHETCLHSYMVYYDKPGTYVLSAQTNPGYYTVYIDKNGHEQHVLKSKDTIIGRAKKIKLSLFSRQYTKTYVVCKKSSPEFPGRIGQLLELVPTKDISKLKPGENLELNIYYKGEEFSGEGVWDATYNGYSTRSEDYFYPRTTIKGAKIIIPIKRSGRWFVRYSFKLDAKDKDAKKCNQQKFTATLVFQIPTERKNKK